MHMYNKDIPSKMEDSFSRVSIFYMILSRMNPVFVRGTGLEINFLNPVANLLLEKIF